MQTLSVRYAQETMRCELDLTWVFESIGAKSVEDDFKDI
jgi:hypothetical protein